MSETTLSTAAQSRPSTPTTIQTAVRSLARTHRVADARAAFDHLGDAVARLSDNTAHLDDTENLILALQRSGHSSDDDADRLHAAYLTASL